MVNFKVYKRKIDVYVRLSPDTQRFAYSHSTNAYPTCKAAVAAAKLKSPNCTYKASFA